jgi:hypothetical protein
MMKNSSDAKVQQQVWNILAKQESARIQERNRDFEIIEEDDIISTRLTCEYTGPEEHDPEYDTILSKTMTGSKDTQINFGLTMCLPSPVTELIPGLMTGTLKPGLRMICSYLASITTYKRTKKTCSLKIRYQTA